MSNGEVMKKRKGEVLWLGTEEERKLLVKKRSVTDEGMERKFMRKSGEVNGGMEEGNKRSKG